MPEEKDPTQNPPPSETPAEPTPAETPAATDSPEAEKPVLPDFVFALEDAGVLKKKITVTVPRGRIDAKLNDMFGELSSTALVPGFRTGHAPRRLIEKRFGKEIGTDVRNALVGEALNDLVEKQKLHTVSEPDFKLDDIKLPDAGDMTFELVVEVAPDFELPPLEGIEVKRAAMEVTEARIDEALENLRGSQAKYEPTEEAAIEGDVVLVGTKITGEGIEPVEKHGLAMRVAPGQVEGLPLLDLGKVLAGKKANDVATLTVKAPEAHPTEAWRNKDLTVELTVSQVRRTVLPEINEDWAKGMGFEGLPQAREFLKTRLKSRVEYEVQRDMRAQICKHLLDTIKFDLPEGVVERHSAQLLRRKAMDLLYQGVPQEKIAEYVTQMQATIGDEAKNDLRLSFILGKLAEEQKIEVLDGEINSRVAAMAQQQNRRPERLRQDMESDGSLGTVVDNLREEKALDVLLAKAKIVEATKPTIEQAGEQPKPE
jgi:trigger factor